MDELFTLDEVAKKLKISKTTMYRMVTNKAIRCLKVGGRWRISSASLDEYLAR